MSHLLPLFENKHPEKSQLNRTNLRSHNFNLGTAWLSSFHLDAQVTSVWSWLVCGLLELWLGHKPASPTRMVSDGAQLGCHGDLSSMVVSPGTNFLTEWLRAPANRKLHGLSQPVSVPSLITSALSVQLRQSWACLDSRRTLSMEEVVKSRYGKACGVSGK